MARLIEPHVPALRRSAWALLRNGADADDLVQDCLERAVSRWHQRRSDGEVKAWLFAILHNLFVSGRRDAARRRRSAGPAGAERDDVPAPMVAANADEHLAVRSVLAAFDSLPEEQRAVLVLVGVEDFSYEEAARLIGVPVGTVMSRLSRGRERLRRLLESGEASRSEAPPALRRVK